MSSDESQDQTNTEDGAESPTPSPCSVLRVSNDDMSGINRFIKLQDVMGEIQEIPVDENGNPKQIRKSGGFFYMVDRAGVERKFWIQDEGFENN